LKDVNESILDIVTAGDMLEQGVQNAEVVVREAKGDLKKMRK
jgi:hypothetical protein